MKLSRLAAFGAAATIVIAGCATSMAGVAGVDTDAVVTSSTSRTIQSPTVSTTSSTTSTTTTSTSTSSSSSSTSSSTSSVPEEDWSYTVEAHTVPAGLRSVSPNGEQYATVGDGGVCIGVWNFGTSVCPVPQAAESVFTVFSEEGNRLAALLTNGGLSSIWIINMADGSVAVIGADGVLTNDVSAPGQFAVSSAAWSFSESYFLVQMLPTDGAETGDLWAVSTTPGDGVAAFPIPANLAGSYPQMWDSAIGTIYVPNTGELTGQIWLVDLDFEASQIGTGSYGDGGTVLLQSVAPDGSYAMICAADGSDLGQLEAVDLSDGDRYDFLKGEPTCQSAVFDPTSLYAAVAGPFEDRNLLTVFNQETEDIPTEFDLQGPTQVVPAYQTWSEADVITVTPADLTDPTAKVNVVHIVRG